MPNLGGPISQKRVVICGVAHSKYYMKLQNTRCISTNDKLAKEGATPGTTKLRSGRAGINEAKQREHHKQTAKTME